MKSLTWLNTRKYNIIIILFDFLLISYLFTLISINLEFNKNIYILILFNSITWSLTNYILGNYSFDRRVASILIPIKHIAIAITIAFLILYCTYFVYMNINISYIFSDLLKVFTTSIFIVSILKNVLRKYIIRDENWLCINYDISKDSISKIIELSPANINLKIELINLNDINLSRNYLFNYINSFSGIIIKDVNELNNLLTDFQVKMIKEKGIFSFSEWCNNNLQRIPTFLMNEEEIKEIKKSLKNKKYFLLFKRIFDIFFSSLLLILTFPIIIFFAVVIYLQDRGSIFYKQIRSGYKNKEISIYKLRSMINNAETGKPIWATHKDERITPVGSFLRMTRIDELPQLLTVLKGEMSLIGPRPERPEIEKSLKKRIIHYDLKYYVKPGLSGWAQVNYPYGASLEDSNNKLSYDVYYLKNYSLLLDLLIFLKTLRLVFTAKGSEPINKK